MRLLLIEDDQAYQFAMACHLRQLPGVLEVRVAGDGEMGLELWERCGSDLVLLDLVLPGIGGLETCRRFWASARIPVLILTSHDDPQRVRQMWEAGASGYLHKEQAFDQVHLALPSLLAGASWWDRKATQALQSHPAPASGSLDISSALGIRALTRRERDVLACVAEGEHNRAIARRLGIGEGTVRSHLHVVLQKLGVSNRTQAALLWHQAPTTLRGDGSQTSA